jgi:hypothetical protein
MSLEPQPPASGPRRIKYVPVVGPRLKILLFLIFALFALLGVNSVYLGSVTLLEWAQRRTYQNYFYQYMFLMHLALGLLIVLPVVLFGVFHIINARNRPNKRAIRAGYALFAASLIVLASGIALTRMEAFGFKLDVRRPGVRNAAYWIHVIAPLVVVWLFVLHRLAGRRIKWKVGIAWVAVAGAFALTMTFLHSQDPRRWNIAGPNRTVDPILSPICQ